MNSGETLRAEVMRPSALGASERAAWERLQADLPALRRAFLGPSFACASERANGRAYVAVLHRRGAIQGFLPFQFRTEWHRRLRLAERIGGGLADAAGLVAVPGLRTSAQELLRAAGLAILAMGQLLEGQEAFGLEADWSGIGHVTEIDHGPDAYFAALLQRDRGLVRDTERAQRKAEATYGAVRFSRDGDVSPEMIAGLIEQKRRQYQRTRTGDVFAGAANRRLIAALNEAPAPDCRLVMHRLEADGRVLAEHIGLQHHDVLSYWFPVYDHDARSVSPGRLLLWHMIRGAADDGTRLIDYGAGDAEYKRKFATAATRYGHAEWSGGGMRSLAARAWRGLEWRLRAHRLRRQIAAVAPG